ncbi:MAG TPA: Crp/Fnr family transcriptional regulator [Aggregatilineales bacterium]|nr:Crp/Fnr family transcriptional regulator [Aggregatilineales bacterium]
MSVTIKTLMNFAGFEKLTPVELEAAAQVAQTASFQRHQVFYAQGDSAPGLIALKTGMVKLYRQSRGKTQILNILGAGDIFGAETLFDTITCPYTAAAITSGTAVTITPEALQGLLAQHPALLNMLLELLWGRLRDFTTLVQNLAFEDVATRLSFALMQLARIDSETDHDGDAVVIRRRLSQQELANLVGTSREVIYRTLKKFEEQGFIQVSAQYIIIHDFDAFSRQVRFSD